MEKHVHNHWTKGCTERINLLRDAYWNYPPTIDIERAKVCTRTYQEHEDEDIIVKRAMAFRNYMAERPIQIMDHELIVGAEASAPRMFAFCPEISCTWVRDELDTVTTRAQDPYVLSDEDRETLRNEILPYWEGKTMEDYFMAYIPDDLANVTIDTGVVFGENKTTIGGGETSVGYEKIIFKRGFKGIQKEAEEKMDALDKNDISNFDQRQFYKAVILACDGIRIQSERYACLAEEMAFNEANETRKKELLEIAERCRRVPWDTPRTMADAIQAIAFVEASIYANENCSGVNIGRVDQYLYPYYLKDKENGILDDLGAQELMECLWIKLAECLEGVSAAGAEYYVGYQPYHGVTLGGITAEGKDGANELTFMGLQATMDLQMHTPTINVRVNKLNSDAYLMKIADLIACGTGQPAVHFDETTMEMLKKSGVADDELWNYTLVGCVSPQMSGETTQWNEGGRYCYPTAVEWALFDGYSYVLDRQMGLHTGDPRTFKTYEMFEEATKKQMDYLVGCACRASQIAERVHQMILPKPFRSCLVEGPLDAGVDIMHKGGSKYFGDPGLLVTGIADLADSMAAVKKLVYDEKRITMDELIAALRADFEGYEEIQRMLIDDAPKYGNDIPYVDEIAGEFVKYYCDVANRYVSIFGSTYSNGLVPVMANVLHGKAVWALPSGRKAKEPLADGMSPYPGFDKNGPTAVLKSVCAIDHTDNKVGTLLNLKLTPQLIKDKAGKEKLVALLRAEEMLGGYHVQFNVVDRETLLDAQEHPEKHSDLLVRVAGYSAFFVDLRKEAQDLIINRIEVSAW